MTWFRLPRLHVTPRRPWSTLALVAAVMPLQGCQELPVTAASTRELSQLVDSEPDEAQQAVVDAFLRAHPTNPIVDGTSVSFLVPAERAPRLIGDFNGWGSGSRSGGRMRRLGTTNWFTSTVQVPLDARVEYLIADGSTVEPDGRNPQRVLSVGGEASEVTMPDYAAHAELDAIAEPPAGRLEEHVVGADDEGGGRRVTIYLPAGYDAVSRYPVAFFQDGALMVQRGVPQILDALQAERRIEPLVAVFVDPISRADDYRMSETFRRFFLDELLPWAEARLSLSPDPSDRAVIGVSRGAVAALDLALHAPERFGRCGLLIPSFAPTPILDLLSDAPTQRLDFAVVAAAFDREWLPEAQTLETVLEAKGYPRTVRIVPEGHNVQTWRAHLDDVLVPFFTADATVEQ